MTWTRRLVIDELVHAYSVLRTVPVRDSYRLEGGSCWPSHTYEADEVEEQRKQAVLENRKPRSRRQYSPKDIRRMEDVLLGDRHGPNWFSRYLADAPAARNCLAKYAIWTAYDLNHSMQCRKRGWAYSTFRRRAAQGADMLADALNEAGYELP